MMKLIKYGNPLTARNGDWDALFDFGQRTFPLAEALFGSLSPRPAGERLAPVSVTETEESYEVKAELPGFVKKEVSVTMDDDDLSIVAERAEKETEGSTYSGKVTRVLSLPGNVLAETAKASLTNGVLAITLPKVPAPKPRTLKIT